jgi:iron complex transport system permease protein
MLRVRIILVVLILLAVMVLSAMASLAYGDVAIALPDVISVLLAPDTSEDSFVVHEIRLPRVGVGLLVGAALGMAGTIVQATTRNSLCSTGHCGGLCVV